MEGDCVCEPSGSPRHKAGSLGTETTLDQVLILRQRARGEHCCVSTSSAIRQAGCWVRQPLGCGRPDRARRNGTVIKLVFPPVIATEPLRSSWSYVSFASGEHA